VLGAWLLVAVELTSLAMRRLPRKVWRVIHLSSYVAFWLTAMHAAFAGTDATRPMYQITAAASILAVAWALMYRVANRRAVRRAARTTGVATPVAARVN
jgi:DMSO/TMAO reductase YedYZ heme-binding membrane subunit